MKNENVLQNFLAGLAGDQTEKNILPLDKRPYSRTGSSSAFFTLRQF